MKTFEEIKDVLAKYKEELSQKYKVREIGIFGSYIRGEQQEKSDVDILVEFEEPVSLLKLVSLENYLKEITDVKVDVVPKKDVRPELKERILKEVIYI
ncbi:MAG: nucleotidyltransferase family protein [Methanophagales archaeon]|nr:nucleotidyltransferase family protein [Methanophagales archaeon]